MKTRRQPKTRFLSSGVIENVDEVLVAMEDLAIWPFLVTLSLASVLQGVEGNTTEVSGRDERREASMTSDNTLGHLDLCCVDNKVCGGNMACIGCLCRCPLNYSFKSSKGVCEAPFVPTTIATNTTTNSSRAVGGGKLPGEACVNSSACVEGLVCSKFKCQCPEPCVYLSEEQACDCGATDNVVWPIVVGVMVGLIIVAFWGMCITSSVKSHMEERNKVMQLSQQQVPRISTLGAAYGSDHLAVPPSAPPLATPAHTTMPSPTPTPAPLRLTRQAVAPTPPPQPVFRGV